jgi:patatin-related protein
MSELAGVRNGARSSAGDSKELRLGLVCYGGVSLAIYMHGATKEIHRLVRASRSFESDSGSDNPFPVGTVEHVYWAALSERAGQAGQQGVRTRVVVDVIAGTSAGGINGVILAKALAHDLSQDALRDLWMDKGDMKKLMGMRYLPWLPLKGLGWFLGHQVMPHVPLVSRWLRQAPPLKGNAMFTWILDALEQMDTSSETGEGTLMPPGHELELFVTATDVSGYPRLVPLDDPRQVANLGHRHVLTFRYGPGKDQFDAAYNPALAFAARATSCFPGAFPPINIANVAENVPGWDDRTFRREFFADYAASHADPTQTYFIDGGVLDNFPFGHAIQAIIKRPAWREVERRLVFIQPDPGPPAEAPTGAEPGWVGTIWAGLSTLPREEPIADDLLTVEAFNGRVRRMAEVIDHAFPGVERQVFGVDRPDDPAGLAFSRKLEDWREDVNRKAVETSGLAYGAYLRLKLHSVVERFAEVAASLCGYPPASNQAFFIKDVVHRWAKGRPEIFHHEDFTHPSFDQIEFLKTFDLGYTQRRIRFVISGLNELYQTLRDIPVPPPSPTRAQLDQLKGSLYDLYGSIDAVVRGDRTGELAGSVRRAFDDELIQEVLKAPGSIDTGIDGFLSRTASHLDLLRDRLGAFLGTELGEMSNRLFELIQESIRDWDPAFSRVVLVRYLGFPLWDVLVYPIQKLSDVGELHPIHVMRMSPDDAVLLSQGGARAKLQGIAKGHFGAFFKRKARENDYLWGRLDAAERLIRMLIGSEGPSPLYRQAFEAILDEEEPVLTSATGLIRDLRERLPLT